MENGLPVGVHRLALLPVTYLLRQDEHFDQLCPELNRFGDAYRDVFVAGFWGYQLYSYLALIGARFGSDMRQAVRTQFLTFFDELAGAGQAVDATLALIERAAQRSPDSSATIADVGITTEMKVALALLLGLSQSPDHEPDPERRLQRIREMPVDVDWQLSRCLSRCHRTMQDTFSTLLDCLELDALVYGNSAVPAGNSYTH